MQMISALKRFRKTGRAIAAASLATLIGASLPVAAFAQEGIVPVQHKRTVVISTYFLLAAASELGSEVTASDTGSSKF
jgi:hypothetical protein